MKEFIKKFFDIKFWKFLGVGVINFKTGIQGAWMNVKINLPGVKDEAFAAEAEAEGKKILAEAAEIADRLYKAIEEEL